MKRDGQRDITAVLNALLFPQGRFSSGVKSEMVALSEIPHLKGFRARLVYKAGLKTPLDVAAAHPDRLYRILVEGMGSCEYQISSLSVQTHHRGRSFMLLQTINRRFDALSARLWVAYSHYHA